jgi:hypothetical protein
MNFQQISISVGGGERDSNPADGFKGRSPTLVQPGQAANSQSFVVLIFAVFSCPNFSHRDTDTGETIIQIYRLLNQQLFEPFSGLFSTNFVHLFAFQMGPQARTILFRFTQLEKIQLG